MTRFRKERQTPNGWEPTGQEWGDNEPIATTITPGRTRITRYDSHTNQWEKP